MKFIKLLQSALASVVLPVALLHADTLAEITNAGVVRIAVPQDFPPFGSVYTDRRLRH